MKIIMVGAVRFSNFGDILFAKLYYEQLRKLFPEAHILFYETVFNPVSTFCRKELGYIEHFTLKDLRDADVLLYFSGGYFANSFEDGLTKLLWHIRYALPGLYFSKKKKDIYVIGVGGGEFSWKYSASVAKKILNSAKYISVRNKETKAKFNNLGVTNEIHVLSDTAQVVRKIYDYSDVIDDGYIFLHIIPNDNYYSLLEERVFPAIKKYLEVNKDFILLIGYDSKVKETYDSYINSAIHYFGNQSAIKYEYNSIDDLIKTLKSCKAVITPKLHVGIVSASFNKPVISFPINYEKTGRYYRSIGCAERCININDLNKDKAYQTLVNYINSPIHVDDKIVELAEENLTICSFIGHQGEDNEK